MIGFWFGVLLLLGVFVGEEGGFHMESTITKLFFKYRLINKYNLPTKKDFFSNRSVMLSLKFSMQIRHKEYFQTSFFILLKVFLSDLLLCISHIR